MVIPSKVIMLSDEIIHEIYLKLCFTHLKLCWVLISTNICKLLSLLICYNIVTKIKNLRFFKKTVSAYERMICYKKIHAMFRTL